MIPRDPYLSKCDDLLSSIEQNCDPAVYLKRRDRFMIDCLSLIEHRLLPIAKSSFQTAKDYHSGMVPINSVVDALEACWREVDGERGMHLEDPDVSAMRAVICLLISQRDPGSEDFLNLLSFFLQLLNNVEHQFEQHEALLRSHFKSCLESVPPKSSPTKTSI